MSGKKHVRVFLNCECRGFIRVFVLLSTMKEVMFSRM